MKELLDYLHNIFPVPDHNHFEMLPEKEQWKIIGQGEVITEAIKFYESIT